MSPEQATELISYVKQLMFICQTLVYMDFALLGGMVALGFFTFWKKVV